MSKANSAPALQTLQVMPHSIEIEQAFLARLMADNQQYYDIMDIVSAEHFYNMLNAKVFTAIGKLINSGKDASPLALVDFMTNDSVMVDINGVEFLAELSNSIIGFNLVDYAEQIRDFYIRRALIQTYTQGIEDAMKPSVELSTSELMQNAEQKIFAIGKYMERAGSVADSTTWVNRHLQTIESSYQAYQDGKTVHLNTGIDVLDKIIGGIRPHNLIVIGAPTGCGKTALAITMALKMAKNDRSIFFASLEMNTEEIAERISAQETAVPAMLIANGNLNNQKIQTLIECGNNLKNMRIHIDDSPQLSLASLRSKAMKIKRSQGLDAIFIDYLQLMERGNPNEKTLERVTKISRGLKALAKELEVPVIALAQLSREPEKRQDGRPKLSDLRDSGTIEQDADVVLLLYREHDFLKNEKPKSDPMEQREFEARLESIKDKVEIIVAKNRRGHCDKAMVRFIGQTMKFESI